ncbi:unnamed protein product [Bursaphelenchus okinawaensis]|uniref:BHLH domain-containing protein n=1 Tax=Bursaphelenchus okinawaensis TaxID=465554 RepID=A0A811KBG5_9BILA|nr:unnamed protein product [Bursaphelenchus okinawaensis]CAG9097385.1 unnamed protein product [Bursaphelenchus okinawaensis]
MMTSIPAYNLNNLNLLPNYTNITGIPTANNLLYPPGVDYSQINEFLTPNMTVLLPQQPVTVTTEPQAQQDQIINVVDSSPKHDEKTNNDSPVPSKKKYISPFSSEAKIPLPSQLDEMWAYGTTVHRRNQRERERVRQVNDGYARLREHLPLTQNEKRISKVDTLRLTIIYIQHLELMIRHVNHELECSCFLNYQPSGGNSSN